MIPADVFEVVPIDEMPRYYGQHLFIQLPMRGDQITLRDNTGETRVDLEVLYVKHWASDEGATLEPMVSVYTRRWLVPN